MWQRTIDCLGLAVRVRTNAPEIESSLTGVLRSYADHAGAPDADYLLDRGPPPRVSRDGAVLHPVELPIDLLPAFERDLYRHILVLTHDVTLHAGAVVDEHGTAIVVAGHSGAGKSTLVRALLQHGFRYLTEEYVALRPDRTCTGLARALHVQDPAVPAIPGYVCDDYPLRPYLPGTFRLFHPPEASIWRGVARTGCVISIDHAPDAGDTLTRMTSGDALLALWPAIFHRTPDALPQIGPAVTGVPLFRLHTSTPAAALARVIELSRELAP